MAVDENKAIFEIEVKLTELDKAIDKADDVEKAFLESQKAILRGAKAAHLKQKRSLDKQLEAGIISRKQHAKAIIRLEKDLAQKVKTARSAGNSASFIIKENKKMQFLSY